MAKSTKGNEVLAKFFDEGVYTSMFTDSVVTAAFGSANGQPVYAICQHGEAVSASDIKKTVKVLNMAAKTGNPVVTFYNSVGTVLGENLSALNANAKLNEAIAKISGVVPQIAVVSGVCGASNAMAAAAADICIMCKDAKLFLTAPFNSAAAGDKLPDAASSDFAAKAGVASIVVENDDEAAQKAAQLIGLLPANNLSGSAIFDSREAKSNYTLTKYDAKSAADTIVDSDSNIELNDGYGKNVYTALATCGGNAVAVVSTAGENEPVCHLCVSKISRFVRFCDAFGIPVITIINTDGFAKSNSDELSGAIRQATRLMGTYADATTAKIAVITGKAIGPAYMALANADVKIAVEGCTIAPVEPSVAASILYKDEIDSGKNIAADTAKKAAEYAKEVCSAQSALENGVVEFAANAANVRTYVLSALDMLSTKRTQRLPKKHGNMPL